MEQVHIHAPAKVNLVLRVLDRRPDGFHNIWSLMHTVGLEDELRIQIHRESAMIRLQCDNTSLPTDSRNLVMQAASLVRERAGVSVGLHIDLTKRIPMGAGLGGGSSDAAATIAGLNQLLHLKLSVEDMVSMGRALGSDVPFFFFAPSAVVCGRGEKVAALSMKGTRWAVLVFPGFPIETKWAYVQLAHARQGVKPLSPDLDRISGKGELSWEHLVPFMENDFEDALDSTHGMLREIKVHLLSHGAEAALLSGSGSTVFGLFHTEAEAVHAKSALPEASSRWACIARMSTSPLSGCGRFPTTPQPVC